MNPRELRIGNLLQDRISKVPYEVTHNTFSSLNLYIEEEKEAPVEPIPLTDKWAEIFGIKYTDTITYKGYIIMFDSIIITIKNDNVYLMGQHISNIKYVHQFQNFYFTITGEELTIKQYGAK